MHGIDAHEGEAPDGATGVPIDDGEIERIRGGCGPLKPVLKSIPRRRRVLEKIAEQPLGLWAGAGFMEVVPVLRRVEGFEAHIAAFVNTALGPRAGAPMGEIGHERVFRSSRKKVLISVKGRLSPKGSNLP
jgi:hypothetical protein